MSIIVINCADNRLKPPKQNKVKQQREYDVMQKRPSRDALVRFKDEPYQLRYQRMLGEKNE